MASLSSKDKAEILGNDVVLSFSFRDLLWPALIIAGIVLLVRAWRGQQAMSY